MDKEVNQHKRMAMGEKVGDGFGVGSFQGGAGMDHPDHGKSFGHMKDGERGSGKPVKHGDGMPAQAAPDHGPHHHKRG